jgi:hypothetical protein
VGHPGLSGRHSLPLDFLSRMVETLSPPPTEHISHREKKRTKRNASCRAITHQPKSMLHHEPGKQATKKTFNYVVYTHGLSIEKRP